MKKRLFICVVSLIFMSACNAFDKNGQPYDGFGPDITPPFVAGGQFDGDYAGDMTLTENNCANLTESLDSKTPLKLNIIQSGDVVSVGFEDGAETSGSFDKNNILTVVKHDTSNSRLFHIEFSDKNISGDCEYIEGAAVGQQLGEPCAKYSLSLTKGE